MFLAIYPDGEIPGGMGHLALQRVWHSPHSAGESPFSGEPQAKAINVPASFRTICDRTGSI